MRRSAPNFFPLALPFIALLLALVLALLAMLEIGALEYAYAKIGMPHRAVIALLVLSLLGSWVNIPVAELPPERVVSGREVVYFGMRYSVPVVEEWPGTLIAVNVGGAVVPVLAAFVFGRDSAPAVAYAAGSLGTLIGADLFNLRRIRGLGAPVASIGGAGTFDGIFLTGILAVLLA